jgi:fatty acid desaturase
VRPTSTNDYAVLKRQIKESGLLQSQPLYYWMKTIVALTCVGAAVFIAIVAPNPWVLLADAIFMGFAFTQVGLLSHDTGHRQAFRGKVWNRTARSIFGNLCLGLSHTWWNDKHNAHHANPNHLDLDPDMQLPMIAFSSSQIATRRHWLRPLMAIQAFVYVAVLPLQAISMRVTSLQHLLSRRRPSHRWLQLALIAAHFIGYGTLLYFIGWPWGLAFAAVHQASFGVYNSSVFASNHKGMEMVQGDERLDFLREQVMTSRNVAGHPVTDFWYGGLNYQIEHHLFPTMPRCNLRKAQPIIEAFCRERGISYYATGLFASYRESFASLHRESASLRGSTAPAS